MLGPAACIRAGVDIACRHATAANLIAAGRIDIGDQTSQARLTAPRIRITSGRGTALGGELRARDSIDVTIAGSAAGAAVLLAVGQLLDEEVDLARRTLATTRLERTATQSRRDGASGKGVRAAVRAGDDHRRERVRLRQRQLEILRTATVRIADTCHPGVVIRFGSHELRPVEALRGIEFHFDAADQRIVPRDSR